MFKLSGRLFLTAGLMFCSIFQLFAETPVSLDKLPLYKGMNLEAEEKAPAGNGLISGVRKVYSVKASIEDVILFYEKELGIAKRFEDPQDQNNLKAGQSTKPVIQVYFWDDSQFVDGDWGAGGSSKRAWIKKELNKRKKDKENAWIESANSEWYYRNTKSSMTALHIMFQDLSINEDEKKYDLKTEIIIEVITYEYEI